LLRSMAANFEALKMGTGQLLLELNNHMNLVYFLIKANAENEKLKGHATRTRKVGGFCFGPWGIVVPEDGTETAVRCKYVHMESTVMGKQLIGFLTACVVGNLVVSAWCDPGNKIRIESMIGKYEGMIQVVKVGAAEHPYQTQIVSVDKTDKTVSLSGYCPDCQMKELKRTNCKITETGKKIRFTCNGPTSDEEYTFNGITLQATGFGNKYPYTINVTKVGE
jgi:hypothetical protein